MSRGNKIIPVLLGLLLGLAPEHHSIAYGPVVQTWPNASALFHIGDLDEPWEIAFEEAIYRWDDTAAGITIDFSRDGSDMDCDNIDSRNGAWWSDRECDGPWSSGTLAITYYWFFSNNELVEADILFNSNVVWSVYDGPDRAAADFRRVAVHELGHAYGLDHSDVRDSIMHAFINDTFLPTQDDLDGLVVGGGYGFDRNFPLTLQVEGTGEIRVAPFVPGTLVRAVDLNQPGKEDALDCTSQCTTNLQQGLRLDLLAVPGEGESFLGWEGSITCTTEPGCGLNPLTGPRQLTARFSGPPAVPTDVRATDRKLKNKVRITWGTSPGAIFYKIQRKQQGGSWSPLGRADQSPFIDRNARPLVEYLYKVKACDDLSCSRYSSGDGGEARFDKPGNLTASQGDFKDRVELSWSSVRYATSYKVRRSTRSSGGYSTIGESDSNDFTDGSAMPGETYYYRVRACSENGCGALTKAVSGFADN